MRPATFLQSILILSTLIFFYHKPVLCQTITDLDTNDSTNFPNQASSWGANGLVDGTTKWSFCSNLYLLGGYNILNTGGTFSKTFNGLATPHSMILFSMTVQIIDTWDGATDSDRFTVKLDTTTFTSYTFTSPGPGTSLCGLPGSPENGPLQYVINMGHSSSSLSVTVTSLLSSGPGDESFGFRDIKITPYTPTTSVANSDCFIADYSLASSSVACPCPTYPANPIAGSPNGYFQSPTNSGQCLPCDSTCTQCTSASPSSCQACAPGRYKSGTTCPACNAACLTCNGAAYTSCLTCEIGKFLAMNNACIGSCPSPLVQTSTTTGTYIELCNSPCYSTPSTNFLYWDGTCNPYCAAPLTTVYVAPYYLCNYTCQVYEFMYWDMPGVYCSQQCNFPLAQNTTHGRQFCNFPCTDQTNYLYWDGSCNSTCNFPLIPVTNLSRNFCYYPCTAGKYLYFNQSCLSTCEPPFVIVIDGNATYCNYPCAVTQVAYWDGSCSSSCPSPFILKSEGSPLMRYYCTFQCDIDEFLYWNGTCSHACPPPLKYQYFISRSLCQYPCDTASQYLLYNGTCVSSCNYPLYTYIEGGVKLCENICPSTQYLYWNGTCSDTCNSPLLPRTNGGAHFCDFPCSNTAYFLYWNGTCSAACPLPYSQKLEGSPERKYCEYVCNSNEYQYFNGSCQDICTTPYSPRVTNGLKYCDYVCTGISPSIYLYWDGTCLPTCNDPLKPRADATAKFCEFPCESQSQFLYWNGTCSDFCMPPLSQVIQGTAGYVRNFCDFGCNSGEYLYWDGSCQTSCDSPFISKTEGTKNFCLAPCDSVFDYYYPDSQTCKQGCEGPYSIDTNVNYQRCLSPDFVEEGWFYKHVLTPPDGEGKVSFVTVGKLTPHISYLDINMPPRLEAFVASKGRNLFDIRFGSQMSQSMRADFPSYSIPTPFEAQGLYSNFLVNFWKDFSSFYISILIAIGLTICEKAAKILNWITLHACFERLSNIARWNLLLILLTTSVGDAFLFSVLHFRSFSLSGTIDSTILGLLVAVVSVFGAVALVVGSIWLVKKAQASQAMSMSAKERSKDEAMKFIKTWQNYQIVFRGFRKNGKLTQFFYAIYIVRLALPKLIAAAFYGLLPLLQPVLQLVVSLLIIGYILITGPLLKRINKVQLLVVEFITLAINVCVLVLAVFEKVGLDTSNKFAVFVGDFIIASSFFMNVLLIIFLVFKLMNGINFIWAKSRIQKTQDRAQWPQWLQLLALPIQQTGMGFEEMMDFDSRYDDFATDSAQGNQLPELEKIRKSNKTALDSTIGNISERGLLKLDAQDAKREHSLSTLSYYENRFDDINQGKKQNPFSRVETDMKKNPNFESPEFGYARPEQARPEQLDVEDLSPLKNFAGAPQAKFKKFPRQDL